MLHRLPPRARLAGRAPPWRRMRQTAKAVTVRPRPRITTAPVDQATGVPELAPGERERATAPVRRRRWARLRLEARATGGTPGMGGSAARTSSAASSSGAAPAATAGAGHERIDGMSRRSAAARCHDAAARRRGSVAVQASSSRPTPPDDRTGGLVTRPSPGSSRAPGRAERDGGAREPRLRVGPAPAPISRSTEPVDEAQDDDLAPVVGDARRRTRTDPRASSARPTRPAGSALRRGSLEPSERLGSPAVRGTRWALAIGLWAIRNSHARKVAPSSRSRSRARRAARKVRSVASSASWWSPQLVEAVAVDAVQVAAVEGRRRRRDPPARRGRRRDLGRPRPGRGPRPAGGRDAHASAHAAAASGMSARRTPRSPWSAPRGRRRATSATAVGDRDRPRRRADRAVRLDVDVPPVQRTRPRGSARRATPRLDATSSASRASSSAPRSATRSMRQPGELRQRGGAGRDLGRHVGAGQLTLIPIPTTAAVTRSPSMVVSTRRPPTLRPSAIDQVVRPAHARSPPAPGGAGVAHGEGRGHASSQASPPAIRGRTPTLTTG